MKHLLLFIVLVCFSWISLPQTPSNQKEVTLDSLISWVSKHTKEQLNDSALVFKKAHKAVQLSKEKNDKKQLAVSYRNLALWHRGAKTIDSTMYYLQKAILIYKDLGSGIALAETYLETQDAYKQRRKYSEAMIYDFKALELYEKANDKRGIAISYTKLGDLLYYQDKSEEGVDYCQKAIEILKDLNHPQDLALSYQYLANNQLFVDDLDDALVNVNKSIDILLDEKVTGPVLMGAKNSRANILKYMNRLDDALGDYKTNLKEAYQSDNIRYKIVSNGNIGHVYLMQEQYKTALPYFLEAIEVIKKTGNTKNLWENYYHTSVSYEKLGDYKKSLEFNILASDEREAYYNTIIDRLESELQIKYETAKKDETIEVQDAEINRQRRIQLLYISIAGLLGVILFGMYFTLKSIRKKRKALTELNIELTQKRKDVEASNTALKHSLEELKITQNQLIHSEKMASLGELTAGIAHEIQNPLNFVNNFSEVSNELLSEMEEEIKKGDFNEAKGIAKDIKQNLEKINHHGKRADAIVKGMLLHSRKSNGQKELTDINELADEYLRLAYHGLRAKDKSFNATMITDFDETLGKVSLIPQDIGRVILNLTTNAFYAIDEKRKQQPEGYQPTVWLNTKKTNNKVLITVKDNGNGIPKKVLDKIFQPFFTTKPTGEGTGLGLSLSYDMINAMNGEINVKTTNKKGTEFTVQIPIT